MGLCASSNAQRPGAGDSSSAKYAAGESKARGSGAGGLRRQDSAANVTERKIETALAAAHRKKKARMVVTDRSGTIRDSNFQCPKIPKSADQAAFLTAALTENFFMFPDLEAQSKEDMVGAMSAMSVKAGEELIRQGDQGDKMYVVASGAFDILVDNQKVSSAGERKVIGELALVYQVRC